MATPITNCTISSLKPTILTLKDNTADKGQRAIETEDIHITPQKYQILANLFKQNYSLKSGSNKSSAFFRCYNCQPCI